MPKSLVSSMPDGWVDEETMRAATWPENPNLIRSPALRALCRRRQFPHLKIGKKLFFRLDEVQAYLSKNRVPLKEAQVRLNQGGVD